MPLERKPRFCIRAVILSFSSPSSSGVNLLNIGAMMSGYITCIIIVKINITAVTNIHHSVGNVIMRKLIAAMSIDARIVLRIMPLIISSSHSPNVILEKPYFFSMTNSLYSPNGMPIIDDGTPLSIKNISDDKNDDTQPCGNPTHEQTIPKSHG